MKNIFKKIETSIEDSLEHVGIKNGIKYFTLGMAGIMGYVSCGSGIISKNPYIRGNLGDSFLSGAFYYSLRYWGIPKVYSGIATFCVASLAEISQLVMKPGGFDPLNFAGTFDPLDFLAYGLGVIQAIGLDSVIKVKDKPKNKGLESFI